MGISSFIRYFFIGYFFILEVKVGVLVIIRF